MQVTVDVDPDEFFEEVSDRDLIEELVRRRRRAKIKADRAAGRDDASHDAVARDHDCADLIEAWNTRDQVLFERALRSLGLKHDLDRIVAPAVLLTAATAH